MITETILLNAGFLVFAALVWGWALYRTKPGPVFPGPEPVGAAFKTWLVVIWVVGIVFPLAAMAWDGGVRGVSAVWVALAPYAVMFVLQVVFELVSWKRLASPIWVIVPCLFLPWRVFQVAMGLEAMEGADAPVTVFTLYALLILWLINIGVHYSNIPNSMRWSFHAKDIVFPSLTKSTAFGDPAQPEDAAPAARKDPA